MKRFLITFTAVFAAAVAAVAVAANSIIYEDSTGKYIAAEVFRAGGTTDKGTLRSGRKTVLVYDSGVVGSGAAINSGALDTSGCEYMWMVLRNIDGGVTRVLTINRGDGSMTQGVIANNGNNIASGANGLVSWGVNVPANNLVDFVTPVASFSVAANGSGNAQLRVWCR